MRIIKKTQKLITLYLLKVTMSFLFLISCSEDTFEEDKSLRPDLYTYVPDDNFEQLLINQGYDEKLDNYILTSNVINVQLLLGTNGFDDFLFDSSQISDFTGIEAFISLESFDCSNLRLKQIDLSNNLALKSLSCSLNNFTSLDLTNLTELETLDCSFNSLTSLKLNGAFLTYLSCQENSLSELDLSTANNLLGLTCFSNMITSLNLSNTIDLERLQLSDNLFTNLDISKNVALKYMECNLNPLLTCVQVNEEQLLTYNWSFCSRELFSLNCE